LIHSAFLQPVESTTLRFLSSSFALLSWLLLRFPLRLRLCSRYLLWRPRSVVSLQHARSNPRSRRRIRSRGLGFERSRWSAWTCRRSRRSSQESSHLNSTPYYYHHLSLSITLSLIVSSLDGPHSFDTGSFVFSCCHLHVVLPSLQPCYVLIPTTPLRPSVYHL